MTAASGRESITIRMPHVTDSQAYEVSAKDANGFELRSEHGTAQSASDHVRDLLLGEEPERP